MSKQDKVQPGAEYGAESVAALLRLVGVAIDAAGAANVAASLSTQVRSANKAFASLPFEAEPAVYLAVGTREAP